MESEIVRTTRNRIIGPVDKIIHVCVGGGMTRQSPKNLAQSFATLPRKVLTLPLSSSSQSLNLFLQIKKMQKIYSFSNFGNVLQPL